MKSSLLFLGHFVGDIHQVVHIGRKSDLGGNKIFASWFEENDYDDIEHLRVDESMSCLGPFYRDEPTGECIKVDNRRAPINLHKIWDLLMIDRFITEKRIEGPGVYPYKEYVKEINKASSKQISLWQNSYVLEWAQESLCYRPWVYQMDNTKLGNEYYKAHIKTLNTRLLMGGYRLGMTLNRIFDPAVRIKYSNLQKQESDFSKALLSVKQGRNTTHKLSMDQCPVGIFRKELGSL